MNNIYISILLLCVIIIICLIFYFSGKKSKNPNEAFSSSYLTKDELTNVIRGKISLYQSVYNSSIQYKRYYNVDNKFTEEIIINGIVQQGISSGTYNIISKNNNGYIEMNYINIHESPDDINTGNIFNKQHPNSIFKTMKNIMGPFTLYQNNIKIKGQILSFTINNNIYFYTVFPQ